MNLVQPHPYTQRQCSLVLISGTISCNNCGKEGHRYTNCGVALKPSLLMRKNKHGVHNFFLHFILHCRFLIYTNILLSFQPNRKSQATASTAPKPPAAPKPTRSTSTSTRNTRQAAPTPKNKRQSSSAARTSRSTPTTRAAGRAPYAPPRAAASHAAAGPSHGQKRKRKPTRWDDYFTTSGNHWNVCDVLLLDHQCCVALWTTWTVRSWVLCCTLNQLIVLLLDHVCCVVCGTLNYLKC